MKITEPDIYPNPVTDILNIKYISETEYNIRIVNSFGQNVFNGKYRGSTTIDIENFAPGSYTLILTDKKDTWQKKFVKL